LTTGRIVGENCTRRKVNTTPASLEQCSRLHQSRWCRYWLFLLRILQQWLTTRFSGPDNPIDCPSPWVVWTPSINVFGPTPVYTPNGTSIGKGQFFFLGGGLSGPLKSIGSLSCSVRCKGIIQSSITCDAAFVQMFLTISS